MPKNVLITGGAGFIGSHLCDALLARGHRVRALDDLSPQVHGPDRRRPSYLAPEVELEVGDVRDASAVRRALRGVDVVVHLAAKVGVGQSMYQVDEYTQVNNGGTAALLQALIERPVGKLVVASSMSVYGEGLYRSPSGEAVTGAFRPREQLARGDWAVRGEGGEELDPVPTPETKPVSLESVYALSKYDQERLCLIIGRAYRIPTVALRFFNVYGPRQALSNPYTGVMAIFASRLMNGARPIVFEDGGQRRDFVSVHDVVQACEKALEAPEHVASVLNVGCGRSVTVREVATKMAELIGRADLEPELTGQCRLGDIRHCFADVSLARRALGYEPRVTFEAGMAELVSWLGGQQASDRAAEARAELEARGLTLAIGRQSV